MAVRSVTVRSECPYIKLWLGRKYAMVEVDFYDCKGLDTPDLRRDVFKLFEKVVLAKSSYWGKLLQKNKRLREAVVGFSSGTLSHIPPITLGSFVFGLGHYGFYGLVGEKRLIEDLVPELVKMMSKRVTPELLLRECTSLIGSCLSKLALRLLRESGGIAREEELVAKLEGILRESVREALRLLLNRGDAYIPRPGFIALLD